MDDINKIDQAFALYGDTMPPLWRRIYLQSIESGFTPEESFQLLKVYILSQSVKYEK